MLTFSYFHNTLPVVIAEVSAIFEMCAWGGVTGYKLITYNYHKKAVPVPGAAFLRYAAFKF